MNRPSRFDHSHTFGGQRVSPEERDRRMQATFSCLAPFYDRLLDIQTFGLHRYWRWVLVRMMAPQPGWRILDVAGGSGEMAKRLAAPDRQVIVLESSIPMIDVGRAHGIKNVDWVAGLARALPFPDASMDAVVSAFGIRNLTYVEAGLKEILRVLKPGSCFYCLEASRPCRPVRLLHYAYCRYLVPRLGALVTRVPEAYDYLVDSILDFPGRTEFGCLLEDIGFTQVHYHSLTMGTVCIHVGTRPE
jgi:demethylmenaquinone methyltransferase/2-methoxy-6-polyprenyl-1,4-benzoquinol methylase